MLKALAVLMALSAPAFAQLTGAGIQSQLNAAAPGTTVTLAAGNYAITTPLMLPCASNLTLDGSAGVTLTTSSGFIATGSNCTGLTIRNVKFVGGGLYFGATNHSGLVFTGNSFGSLPSTIGGTAQSSAGIYIDGNLNTTATFTATGNTFGDGNSCTAVFGTVVDEGGYCAGIYVQTGIALNNLIDGNTFTHVEEGIHYHQFCSGCATGTNVSVSDNLQITHNSFVNFHRIAIEIQTAVVNHGQVISHNFLANPINPSWGTMFISDACCTTGRTYLNSAPPPASNVTDDNVMYADSTHVQTVGQFFAPVIGIEFWGGPLSEARSNVMGGAWSNMINWGYGTPVATIAGNYLCGAHNGTYITDEEGDTAFTPVGSDGTGNTLSSTCAQQTSTAPTISISGATFTLADSGANHSIWYTTDGSTPVPGASLRYLAPFTVSSTTTVKAVGMWGTGPQPAVHEAPFGYAPSAVVTATYTGGVTPPSITYGVGHYTSTTDALGNLTVTLQ